MKYVIITYTGVHYFISEEQEKKLQKLGINDEMIIDNNILKMKNIADVLTEKKYYETYPDKKPIENKSFQSYEPVKFSKVKYINSLEQMIKGFSGHFKSREMPYQSQKMLKHMKFRLERAQKAPDDAEFTNPLSESKFSEPMWDFIHN